MKNRFFRFKILCFFALFYFLPTQIANAQQLVVNGQKIVNSSNGQEVILNAMNMGNWMVMEGYIMNSKNQATSQHIWKQKLTTLLGATNTKIFYDAWLNNHVTQADINQLKTWGFNAVRLPLHYEYFVNLGTPDVWNEEGFVMLDNVLSWCESAGIYAIIDLHAAPGGQSNNDISDYDNTKPSLWESAENRSKTVRLWDKLSERYKNKAWVAGYDLINEPAWDIPNGTLLREIYGQLTDVIRANADNHILFIEGNWYANDYTGLTPAWDPNIVYAFHKYWSDATSQDIKWITDFRTAQNRPIWCGEHGENSNHHFTKIVETFNANGIGFSWWPMKKFESFNCFASANFPAGYQDLLNYMGGTNPSYNSTTGFNTCMALAESVKLANTTVNTEVLRSIFTQPGNRNTAPFTTNSIPGRIYAANYDMGMNGYAFSDRTYEDVRLTTGIYTNWNDGWVYRNNGGDTEKCSDALANGYSVGWFESSEWMNYTVNVANAGTYTIELRVANGGSPGTVQILNGNGTQILATATVPATGGWGTWQTISCTGGFSTAGTQTIRVLNTANSYNLASINFVYVNAAIPATSVAPSYVNTISLKGNNGSYVTGTALMTSTALSVAMNEKFTIEDAGGGYSTMKGANGKYVTLNVSDNKLYCNGTTIGNYQKFILNNLSGNMYTIKGFNNLYVSSENGATTGLTCTRTVPGGWEYFNWAILSSTATSPSVPVTGLTLSPTTATLAIAATQQLTKTIAPVNATNQNVTYSSSNTSVATVSTTGLLTGITVGSATITLTTQDGGKTATCAVTVKTAAPTVYTGYYSIFNQKCLNAGLNRGLYASGSVSGANTQIYDISTGGGGTNQRWRLDDAGNGQYYIRVKSNLYRLDLKTKSTSNNIQVVTKSNSTSTSQKWTVTDVGGGYVKIVNVYSGKALEVTGASTSNSALVKQNTYTGATNQKWQLLQVESATARMKPVNKSDITQLEFKLYPNPANNFVSISWPKDEKLSISIYDIKGVVVLKTSIDSKQISIDISSIQPGIYLMRVIGTEKTEVVKFIKK